MRGHERGGGGFRGVVSVGCCYLGIKSGLVVIYVSYPDLIADFDRFGDVPRPGVGGAEVSRLVLIQSRFGEPQIVLGNRRG